MSVYKPPAHTGLDILYQDDSLLALNKPSGLLSVPGRGPEKQDSLVTRCQQEFPDALTIHRLDMETSGIILFARNADAHRQMSQLFEHRQVNKTYQAVVQGKVHENSGVIDLPLIADWPNRPLQKVDKAHGKPSITRWQVVDRKDQVNSTRLELYPQTGRSHQLRVHLHALGYPILGDQLYYINQSASRSDRLLLHATRLEFVHPISSSRVVIESRPDF